jgi:S1-C subfamily serine protease
MCAFIMCRRGAVRLIPMLMCFLLFVGQIAWAQAKSGDLIVYKAPDPSVLPMPVQLKKSVGTIELKCKSNKVNIDGTRDDIKAYGTGFLVSYLVPQSKNQSFQYLATNRHVAMCWDDNQQAQEVTSIKFRVNTKLGSSRRIDLNTIGNTQWFLPSDESVDLALTPITVPPDVDYLQLPVESFATKEFLHDYNILEGSSIILAGFFYQLPGSTRVQSVVRQGILSMVPDEPVKTTTGKLGKVYLGDVHIFGGNSGSPVLVAADPLGMNGYRLLGVVSGYYYEDADFNLEIATSYQGTMHGNSGIAMIVPAIYLRDLIDIPGTQSAPRQLDSGEHTFCIKHRALGNLCLFHSAIDLTRHLPVKFQYLTRSYTFVPWLARASHLRFWSVAVHCS